MNQNLFVLCQKELLQQLPCYSFIIQIYNVSIQMQTGFAVTAAGVTGVILPVPTGLKITFALAFLQY